MVKIYVFLVILCVNLYENDAGNETVATIAKLDFWKPDPKFTTKFFENRKKMQELHKMYHKYNRGSSRITKRTEFQNTAQTHSAPVKRARDVKGHRNHRSKPFDPFKKLSDPSKKFYDPSKNHFEPSKKPSKPQGVHSDRSISKTWPKAKKVVREIRTDGEDSSKHHHLLRNSPMYLMQQPGGMPEPVLTTTTQGPPADDTEPNHLSPYALEKQLQKILSHYTDVNVSYEVLGRTVEYNNILLVKLSEKKTDMGMYFRAEESKYIEEVPEKKIVFIVHALSVLGVRALATLTDNYYFSMLLDYYIQHLDKYDIFLMPMANPDGYVAAAGKTLWNKNMSPQSACEGVAVDRNFDVAWTSAKMVSSCSQLYPGPSAFSETESRAVRDVLHQFAHKIIAYIHVHPGTPSADVFKGDAVLYPKGFTEVQSDDDKYIDLRGEIDEMMRNASFQVMSVTVDTLHSWYGKVYGTSVDYAATVFGIPYSMEFVMQVYENAYFANSLEDRVDFNALTVIWNRIIDVVFKNIYKNMHANEVK